MYTGWVTHTHSHLGGACQHACSYCFVQAMAKRFPAMQERYSGPVRLFMAEIDVNYGTGKKIFIDHLNDLFAANVPSNLICVVLQHCQRYPDNTYIFQTKNPARYHENTFGGYWPKKRILGCTLETNRNMASISNAPHPQDRAMAMGDLEGETFVTIEPILDFDESDMIAKLILANPTFVNIGADSKGHGLKEPSAVQINSLIESLALFDIPIRIKDNLERLIEG